jgi:hypothetical protein
MTVNSCAGYRSPNALNDKQSEQLTGRPPAVPGLPRILPKRLEPTPEVAEHGTMRHEINISGNRLLVACVVAFCLVGIQVYSFVRYWLFAPCA